MSRLQGKVALVTGGGSGIGAATACRFAKEGARVAVVDVNLKAAEGTVKKIQTEGGDAAAFLADVSSSVSVSGLAEAFSSWSGSLDILVNNAGVLDGFAPILETAEEHWDRVLGINLKGMFLITRAFLPAIIESGNGSIINTSSIAGVVANAGGIAYTTSKHGVIGFTRQLQADYGPQVRANVILPGAVETSMTKELFAQNTAAVTELADSVVAGRHSQPDEIANVMLFLASDEASFVYGSVYAVDGGWTLI